MPKSIDIIRTEHRAIAAVLSALRSIVEAIAEDRLQPDFVLLSAMLVYIADVPEALHHPKEDNVLFPRLRQRSPASAAVIDRLEREHEAGYVLTRDLERALIRYQGLGAAAFAQFRAVAERYVEFNWSHLNLEERELLPAARRDLAAEDWAEIDAEFAANADPWAGASEEFTHLFTRIVEMAPAPIGLGPEPPTRA